MLKKRSLDSYVQCEIVQWFGHLLQGRVSGSNPTYLWELKHGFLIFKTWIGFVLSCLSPSLSY